MVHSTVYERLIVFFIVIILYICLFCIFCMFITYSTSYYHCGKLLDTWNVCMYVCTYVRTYVRVCARAHSCVCVFLY